jgi:hypothetical protein
MAISLPARRSLNRPFIALKAVLVQPRADGDFVLGVKDLSSALLCLAMLRIFAL